jgi:hypothetical protein
MLNDAAQLPEPPAIVAPLEAVPIWVNSWLDALAWSAETGLPPWLYPLLDDEGRTMFMDPLLPEPPDA